MVLHATKVAKLPQSGRIAEGFLKQSINSIKQIYKMKKRIAVTKENREFLMKAFKVTERMVFKALSFQSDTDLAKRIRHLATKRGGFVLNMGPAIETIHDHDGYMHQYLMNGVMLEFDKSTGSCDAFLEGECVQHWDNVMVSEIRGIQNWAAGLR